MASGSGIKAGQAYIELVLKQNAFHKGMLAAMKHLKSFGKGLKDIGHGITSVGKTLAAAGGAIIAPLVSSVKTFAATGDALDEMSQRTGISVEALSELGYAADFSGSSLNDVGTGIKFMQKNLIGAATGSKAAANALGDLGLSAKALESLSPEAQFATIAERLTQIQDPAQKAALAMQIFGRSGVNLLPMLQDLPRLRKEAQSLGVVMSTADAKAAVSLADAMDRLWKVIKGLSMAIGAALAPTITAWADTIKNVLGSVLRWVKENQGLVRSIFQIGVALTAAGTMLLALGMAVSFLGSVLVGLSQIYGALAAVVFKVFGALSVLVGMVNLTSLTIVALGIYIVWATGAVGGALKVLGPAFTDLKDTALEAFGGIRDALIAGDLALAGRIAWLGLKAEWAIGINALQNLWIDFKSWLFVKAGDAFTGIAVIAINVWSTLREAWAATVDFFGQAFDDFVMMFKTAWIGLTSTAAKTWAWMKSLVTDVDINAEFKRIDRESYGQEKTALNTAKRAQQMRKDDASKIESDRERWLTDLSNSADERERERLALYDEQRAAGDAEVEAAKEKLRFAVEEARAKREAGKTPPGEPNKPNVPNLPGIFHQVKATFETLGTFSASQALDFGTSTANIAKSQLDELKKQSSHLGSIDEKMDDVGLAGV